MGTRGRPLRFLAVWPLFGASQLRQKGVVVNAREIEGTGDWRIGRSVVCYGLVKLIRLKESAQKTTYKGQDGEMLCI